MITCLRPQYTNQTFDYFEKNTKKTIKKNNKINKKIKFYKEPSYYKEITDYFDLFLELDEKFGSNNKKISNNYIINWNKIKIPDKIKFNLENKVKINDFYPDKLYSNEPNSNIKLSKLILYLKLHVTNILNCKSEQSNQTKLLFEEIRKEIQTFMNINNTNQYKEIMFDFVKNKYYLINSLNNNEHLLLSEIVCCILTQEYILLFPNFKYFSNLTYNIDNIEKNYILFVNNQVYEKKNDIVINIKYDYDIKNSECVGYGFIMDKNQKELFNIKINSQNCCVKKNYLYTNSETNMKIKSYDFYDSNKNLEYFRYNKNNCDFAELYDHNNNKKLIISQCMITDDTTGIRYRGKYSETSQNNKPIKKSVHFDNEQQYLQKGDQVKIDLINQGNKKNGDEIIGYKIAKSKTGELRIVKLFIPPDAKIVRPIDKDYFISFNKERSDKAIVMDIQLPIKDKEISVVPEETTAYSYIYKINNTNSFEYKVGQEVYPDSFNSDENIGCGSGIHYYQNRNNIFRIFMKNN